MEQSIHTMRHVGTDELGRDEFLCDVCGYHFLLSWPPNYHKELITEAGDPAAIHKATVTPIPGLEMEFGDADIIEDDPYLHVFEDFVSGIDFNDPNNPRE